MTSINSYKVVHIILGLLSSFRRNKESVELVISAISCNFCLVMLYHFINLSL